MNSQNGFINIKDVSSFSANVPSISVNINQLCKQPEKKHKNSLLLKLWGTENKVTLFISAFLDGAISAEIEAI